MATSSSTQFFWGGAALAVQLEAAIEQAMEDTGRDAVERAVDLCPVGPDHADGSSHLYEEISADVERTRGGYTLSLVADKPYAVYVVYGTGRQAAQDFIRPAMDEAAERLPERIKARVGEIR